MRKMFMIVVFMFCTVLIYLVSLYLFSRTNIELFPPDEMAKLTIALGYYQYLFSPELMPQSSLFSVNLNYFPPVYFVTSAMVCHLFNGFSIKTCLLSNLIYLVTLIISIFFLTKKISKNEMCALFALFVLLFFDPLFSRFSRHYAMEFGVASFVCLFLCVLVHLNEFKNKYWYIALGLIWAIGMLIKWTFIVYATVPLGGFIYTLILNKRKQELNRLKISFYVGAIIFGIWFMLFCDLSLLVNKYFRTINQESVIFDIVSYLHCTKETFLFYLIWVLIYLPFLLFFWKIKFSYKKFLLTWVGVPFIFYSFFTGSPYNKYLIPIIPGLAVLTSVTVFRFSRKLKKFLIILIIIIGLFIYVSNCLNSGDREKWNINNIENFKKIIQIIKTKEDPENFKDLLLIINQDTIKSNALNANSIYLHYLLMLEKLNVNFTQMNIYHFNRIEWYDSRVFLSKNIVGYDYIIICDKEDIDLQSINFDFQSFEKLNEYNLILKHNQNEYISTITFFKKLIQNKSLL
ncbi:MAG: glycosyltransferase family 39 protein [Candidatus Omnitrophota bacterium]